MRNDVCICDANTQACALIRRSDRVALLALTSGARFSRFGGSRALSLDWSCMSFAVVISHGLGILAGQIAQSFCGIDRSQWRMHSVHSGWWTC